MMLFWNSVIYSIYVYEIKKEYDLNHITRIMDLITLNRINPFIIFIFIFLTTKLPVMREVYVFTYASKKA